MPQKKSPEQDHIGPGSSPVEQQGMDAKIANAESASTTGSSEKPQISDNAQIKNEMKPVPITEEMEADGRIENANTASLIDSEIDAETVQKSIGVSSIWKAIPVERGRLYETVKEANIARNFPVLDDFDPATGVATSYKTMDMNRDSYHDPKTIANTLRPYIDALSDFNGRTWHQNGKAITIRGDDIREKVLCVGIPPSSLSIEQENALLSSKDYATQRGIKLRFEVVA